MSLDRVSLMMCNTCDLSRCKTNVHVHRSFHIPKVDGSIDMMVKCVFCPVSALYVSAMKFKQEQASDCSTTCYVKVSQYHVT
jgi:hypothetical protein